MTLLAKIAEAVQIINEVKQLKVALGFSEDASILDIIAEVKSAATVLASATGSNPSTTETVAPAATTGA